MRDTIRLVLTVLTAAAVLSGSALAGQSTQAEPSTAVPVCRDCHRDASTAGSVHAKLACRECHTGLNVRAAAPPHQPQREIPPPTCTAACHVKVVPVKPGESPAAYADSVHGRSYFQRGTKEVARCWDCHGKHIIKPASDPTSAVARPNIPMMCSRCHGDMNVVLKYNIHAESPYQEYRQSVHGKALFEKGLATFAATCTDCHGVHTIQAAGSPHLQAKDPRTCGSCHVLIFDEYKNSIHGSEALKGNPDVPLCVDCHGEHGVAAVDAAQSPTAKKNIPDTCSTCHSRPDIMRKYGVPEDRIKTFIESFHGIAIGFGDKAEASCTSCHTVHAIRSASNPESSVNPAQLPKTCGQPGCHPGMPARIAAAQVHRDITKTASGAPYYVQKILFWLVIASVLVTGLWFIPELIRRFRRKKP